MTLRQILERGVEKYASPPASIMQSPANPPSFSSSSPSLTLSGGSSSSLSSPTGLNTQRGPAIGAGVQPNKPPAATLNTNTLSLHQSPAAFAPQPMMSGGSNTAGRPQFQPSRNFQPLAPQIGQAADGFYRGARQGVRNMLGAVGNFAIGAGNFVVPGVAGVLAQTSPHKNVRDMGGEWLQQSLAGGRDALESFGQFVGVNNAWNANGQYVGAQAPQHLAQNRQQIKDKYFSNPNDQDLMNAWAGANAVSDWAASTIPTVATGQAAVNAAAKVPVLAQAGNAVKSTIEGSKYLDRPLQVASAVTGMPLHPAALPGGQLSAMTGPIQWAQGYGPPVAAAAAQRAGMPELAQTIAQAQQYMPMVAVDNAVREIVHPDAPEYIDYLTNPAAAKGTLPGLIAANFAAPQLEAQQQAAEQQALAAEQQALAAERQEFRQHIESAYPQQSLVNQVQRADNTDYAMTDAMLNDPAIKNRMQHGALPADAATQIVQQSGLVPPEDQAATVDAFSANAEPTPNAAAAVGTTQNPAPQQTAATDPAAEDPFGDYVETLKTAPAETKQQIEQQTVVPAVVEQIKPSITPEKTEAATLVATKPGTPEAEAAAAPARDQFITDQAGGDPAKPQDPGWYGQVLGMWDSMGPMGQAAFMLGVPTALIGLLSGDGLTGILGGLGIGLLGMGAGAMGMFGAGTQKSMGQLMGQLGGAMGYNVERDANNLMPGSDASKKFEADLTAAYLKDPAEAQKMLDARTAQFQPLEQLHGIHPGLAHSYLMGMDNGPATAEDAAKLYQQLAGQVAAARDPNFLHNQAGSKIINNVNNLKKTVPALLQFGKNLIQNYKTSADMNIAQKIAAKHMLKKASRCWAGYEPVPGKEPYSNNSCRPVGSKKKKQTGKERHHEKTKQGGATG